MGRPRDQTMAPRSLIIINPLPASLLSLNAVVDAVAVAVAVAARAGRGGHDYVCTLYMYVVESGSTWGASNVCTYIYVYVYV